MEWYYARGDDRMGPVDDAEFDALVASGVIDVDTLVWRDGMVDWAPLREAAPDAGPQPAGEMWSGEWAGEAALRPCAECGRSFPAGEMVAYENDLICADCKPVYFQRIRESGVLPGQMPYAGFWIRFAARFVDGVIIAVVNIPLSVLQQVLIMRMASRQGDAPASEMMMIGVVAVFWIISILIGLTYETYFVGKFAATPGKMVCGLKVVMSDGGRVSYGRALGRYFATIVSQLTLMIGFIMAAFDAQKRALHDHICDTRVIRAR
ncbi:MAG: RDD family protein [Candidatus Hydrogenedentes bacterium]|nr:RDD family protein [Candidatus Hydrogenedentota bacterium]